MHTENVLIYVQLLGEGTTVYRPVMAKNLGGGVFQITSARNEDESWEFDSGMTVVGEPKQLDTGTQIVAVRAAT